MAYHKKTYKICLQLQEEIFAQDELISGGRNIIGVSFRYEHWTFMTA